MLKRGIEIMLGLVLLAVGLLILVWKELVKPICTRLLVHPAVWAVLPMIGLWWLSAQRTVSSVAAVVGISAVLWMTVVQPHVRPVVRGIVRATFPERA